MPKKIEMTGRKFGRLTVLREASKRISNRVTWECLCDCGNIKMATALSLRNGHTQSYGCLSIEMTIGRSTTHGMPKKSRAYKSWDYMLSRCRNKKDSGYKYYGGRGIKVCDRWLNFENFFKDMGECPPTLTIERINNNGDYEPSNCYWTSRAMQSRNQRTRKNSKTGITGVHFCKRRQKYIAQIGVNNKQIHVGVFSTLPSAARARSKAEQHFWGRTHG